MNYIEQLDNLKMHKSGNKVSLHKPLLLLLAISEVMRGHDNRFLFDDVEERLRHLLSVYGLKSTQKINPQYPFVYLAGAPELWESEVKKERLRNPDAVSRRDVLGKTGQLAPGFFAYLKKKEHAGKVVYYLIHQYWPEAYHEDLLEDLGLTLPASQEVEPLKQRSRYFVEEVLDSYERKCALCGQSIRLGDQLIGIDACHLKPIQHFGADTIKNGLALCKLHHWALDRGVFTLTEQKRVKVSSKINGMKMEEYFLMHEGERVFEPRESGKRLEEGNVRYHRENIYVG